MPDVSASACIDVDDVEVDVGDNVFSSQSSMDGSESDDAGRIARG